jgi:DNA-binding PadR family transcriptional regulator
MSEASDTAGAPHPPHAPLTPLTPLTMAILLALSKEDLHGYALMREVEAQTDGGLRPGTGSLYAALQRLLDERLIVEAPAGTGPEQDGRRKTFRMTPAGRAAARAEAERMVRVLRTARDKALIGEVPALGDLG